MKIGLVRHFKVDCPHKVMMTSKEFREWSEKYEHARILKKKVNMSGIHWDICYCSDLERAVETAKEVYSGNIYVDMEKGEVVDCDDRQCSIYQYRSFETAISNLAFLRKTRMVF